MEGGKGRWEVRRDREKEGCGQKRRDSKCTMQIKKGTSEASWNSAV